MQEHYQETILLFDSLFTLNSDQKIEMYPQIPKHPKTSGQFLNSSVEQAVTTQLNTWNIHIANEISSLYLRESKVNTIVTNVEEAKA